MIFDINGNPYTSAQEDLRLVDLKKQFRKILYENLLDAMRRSRDGLVQLDMREIEHFIDQAYYMGKEDA